MGACFLWTLHVVETSVTFAFLFRPGQSTSTGDSVDHISLQKCPTAALYVPRQQPWQQFFALMKVGGGYFEFVTNVYKVRAVRLKNNKNKEGKYRGGGGGERPLARCVGKSLVGNNFRELELEQLPRLCSGCMSSCCTANFSDRIQVYV